MSWCGQTFPDKYYKSACVTVVLFSLAVLKCVLYMVDNKHSQNNQSWVIHKNETQEFCFSMKQKKKIVAWQLDLI